MRIQLWDDTDFRWFDVPDDVLRPLVQRCMNGQAWDADIDAFRRQVRAVRLAVADWRLRAKPAAVAPPGTDTILPPQGVTPPAGADAPVLSFGERMKAAKAAKKAEREQAALAG